MARHVKTRLITRLLTVGLMTGAISAAPVPKNPIWQRPTMMPLPVSIAGVEQAVAPISTWKSTSNPSGEFWLNEADPNGWNEVRIGGRGGRGGVGRGGRGGAASTATGYYSAAYRTRIAVPAEWTGKRVVLRFESVGGHAKVWVNGRAVAEHWGPSTAWTRDITEPLKAGRATKENIYEATVNVNGAAVTALSDGRDAVRVYADGNPGRSMIPGIRMSIQNGWNYPDIGLGNYAKPPINIGDGYTNTVYLKLGAGS